MFRSDRWMRSGIAVAVLVAASACGSSSKSGTPSTPSTKMTIPAPTGLSVFYSVPDPLPSGQPGQIIKAQPVNAPGVHGTAWLVMYHSRSVRGNDVPVTGFIIVPSATPPSGGYPMISWSHGLTGVADICTPSAQFYVAGRAHQIADYFSVAEVNQILDRGYLFTGTDFEGLGTRPSYPYLVGDSEARGTIDIVRAARNLPQAHASNRYVVIGHSSGGNGSLFAPHIANTWAPELHLLGSVSDAPPSQLEQLATALGSNANFEILSAGFGFNAAYGDQQAPLDAVLTSRGRQLLADVDRVCLPKLHDETAGLAPSIILKVDPAKVPAWDRLLRMNDAGKFTTPSATPLLIVHGTKDELLPAISSQLLFNQLCKIHQDETRWLYPNANHNGVVHVSLPDVLNWIDHRFAGRPTPDHMTPTAVPGVQVQHCPPA